MHGSSDHDRLSFNLKAARQSARPEIESLLNARDVCRSGFPSLRHQQTQPDAPQMQTMRILAQPVVEFILPFGTDRVTDLPTISIKRREAKSFWIKSSRKRRSMPTPLGHRAERHRLLVLFREGLQAGD